MGQLEQRIRAVILLSPGCRPVKERKDLREMPWYLEMREEQLDIAGWWKRSTPRRRRVTWSR